METNVVELVDSIRTRAGSPLIVCEHPEPEPRAGFACVWVFRETPRGRLEQPWAGVLGRAEIDELVRLLRETHTVWRGGIDTYHFPSSRRFRLVSTLPPAPCRVYGRRGMKCEVERSRIRVRGRGRTRELVPSGTERVEGWFTWWRSGIRLASARPGGEPVQLVRVGHPGAWLGYHDGIDPMVDTSWLEVLVPRIAAVLDASWSIVDLTESPPAVRHGERAPDAPVGDG